jgi:hypothetical protein
MDDSCVLKFWVDPPMLPSPSSTTVPSRLFAQAIWTVTDSESKESFDKKKNTTTTSSNNTTKLSNQFRIVEPVVDSSRYFVVTIVDPIHHRRAYIGIGFRERMDATSLTLALQDYERSRQREILAKKQQLEHEHEIHQVTSPLKQHPTSSVFPQESHHRPFHSTVVPVLRKKPPPPSSSTVAIKIDDDDEWTEYR